MLIKEFDKIRKKFVHSFFSKFSNCRPTSCYHMISFAGLFQGFPGILNNLIFDFWVLEEVHSAPLNRRNNNFEANLMVFGTLQLNLLSD